MKHEILVAVPVLRRPENARPLAVSLRASTEQARLMFICSPGDRQQIKAARETNAEVLIADWTPGRADWSRKLELARRSSDEQFILLGADDIIFHPGWAESVLDVYATYDVGVVGTNDMANPRVRQGQHSTHPVVCRGYADAHGTIDNEDLMLHDGYWHLYVDNELIETAQARGCWAFAKDAYVEHKHPIWRTAKNDSTYERGSQNARDDHKLYLERRRLWRLTRVG